VRDNTSKRPYTHKTTTLKSFTAFQAAWQLRGDVFLGNIGASWYPRKRERGRKVDTVAAWGVTPIAMTSAAMREQTGGGNKCRKTGICGLQAMVRKNVLFCLTKHTHTHTQAHTHHLNR
jgi:hypothetical protein